MEVDTRITKGAWARLPRHTLVEASLFGSRYFRVNITVGEVRSTPAVGDGMYWCVGRGVSAE